MPRFPLLTSLFFPRINETRLIGLTTDCIIIIKSRRCFACILPGFAYLAPLRTVFRRRSPPRPPPPALSIRLVHPPPKEVFLLQFRPLLSILDPIRHIAFQVGPPACIYPHMRRGRGSGAGESLLLCSAVGRFFRQEMPSKGWENEKVRRNTERMVVYYVG